jgi:putative intracellular protease/amidase
MPKVLLALTSHGDLGDTGRTTGFYVPEAAHPHAVFTQAGYEVDFVSVQGGEPPRDGVEPDDADTARFLSDMKEQLASTPTADQIDAANYDAIFFVGGHGTMWDLPDAADLASLTARIYDNGGVVAGVCHGPAGLVNVQLADGSYLVDGKQVSSFTNEEEAAVGLLEVVPFPLESKLAVRGARITKVDNFAPHAVADRRLVTGQNPASARRVAELVIEELRHAQRGEQGTQAAQAAGRISDDQRSALFLLDESVSFLYAATLRAVALAGVADHLADAPRPVSDLAAATGTNAGYLARALRLLATRSIVAEEPGDAGQAAGAGGDTRFRLLPLGRALRSDGPVSVRDAITEMTTSPAHWKSAGELLIALHEGAPVFDRLYGRPYYEHVKDGEAGRAFNRAMASFSAAVDPVAISYCDFPATGTVVDVGGGVGGLLVQALGENPGLRGVLFDQAHVLDEHRLAEVGDDNRWEAVAGDFFAEVPAGGDVYVLKRILHNWSDEQCLEILRACRRAMADGSRLLILDPVIPPGDEPDAAKVFDLVMMMLMPGQERTEAQLVSLLDGAGLRHVRTVSTGAPVSVIEATPV